MGAIACVLLLLLLFVDCCCAFKAAADDDEHVAETDLASTTFAWLGICVLLLVAVELFEFMIRHDDSDVSFWRLLADKLAPNNLFA